MHDDHLKLSVSTFNMTKLCLLFIFSALFSYALNKENNVQRGNGEETEVEADQSSLEELESTMEKGDKYLDQWINHDDNINIIRINHYKCKNSFIFYSIM